MINGPTSIYDSQTVTVQDYVREAILDVSRHQLRGHPNHKMSEGFSNTITALALDKMVRYLSDLESETTPKPSSRVDLDS